MVFETKRSKAKWPTNGGSFATGKVAIAKIIKFPQFSPTRVVSETELGK